MVEKLSGKLLTQFYITQRLSVATIARRFDCSQNRINYWLHRYGIRKRSISEALYEAHNPNGDPFRVPRLNLSSKAFLAGLGVGLYWGEGNKRNPVSVRLGNTDPRLILAFIKFLKEVFGVPPTKFRFGLQVFSDMSAHDARSFWLSKLKPYGMAQKQFQKVIITPARSIGTYREKTQHGVLTVYCSNVRLKRLMDQILAKYQV